MTILVSYCWCKNYHKVSGLKQQKFIVLQLYRSEVQNESYRTKIKVSTGLVSLRGPRGEAIPCLF